MSDANFREDGLSAAELANERARDPRWRAQAQVIADELRAVNTAMATLAPSLEQLDVIAERVRQLRDAFTGPARPRWYEDRDQLRTSFNDLSPVRGIFNPVAPPVCVTRQQWEGRAVIELRATLPLPYEGPPLGVHGGWVAALWDDVLGEAQNFAPHGPGMTAWIKVRYRRPTPVGRELCFRAWLESEKGRRIECRGACEADGQVVSEAEAVFVRVDFEAVEANARDAG